MRTATNFKLQHQTHAYTPTLHRYVVLIVDCCCALLSKKELVMVESHAGEVAPLCCAYACAASIIHRRKQAFDTFGRSSRRLVVGDQILLKLK